MDAFPGAEMVPWITSRVAVIMVDSYSCMPLKSTIMVVAYPRKFKNTMSARDIMGRVVREREAHLVTLNRYRFNEQRSCKDLTDLIERLDGEPVDLVRDLSRHVVDESRHAMWLTLSLIHI